jgi:hypothetical protein
VQGILCDSLRIGESAAINGAGAGCAAAVTIVNAELIRFFFDANFLVALNGDFEEECHFFLIHADCVHSVLLSLTSLLYHIGEGMQAWRAFFFVFLWGYFLACQVWKKVFFLFA